MPFPIKTNTGQIIPLSENEKTLFDYGFVKDMRINGWIKLIPSAGKMQGRSMADIELIVSQKSVEYMRPAAFKRFIKDQLQLP